jgi:flagellar hook-basal body complex protein FliE
MTDVNTVSLINQMRSLANKAEGTSVESSTVGTSFSQVMQQALGKVNDLSQTSDGLKARFEMGDPNLSLADVMVAGQKSSLAFEAALRVRNKAVQAYQDIMGMPI